MKNQAAMATALSIALLGFTGCGGDGESGTSTQMAEPSVRVQTTGDVESTLATRGSFYCGANDMGGPEYVIELYAMSPPQQLNMILNRDLAPGTHSIVGSDDRARFTGADAYFNYTGPDREDFKNVTDGSIRIENMPAARGEELIASIEAEMTGDDGAVISLTAELNVTAGRQSFEECP